MAHFAPLEEKAEDELHVQRLLRVEERPYDRIKNRLLGPATPIQTYLTRTVPNPTKTGPNPDEPQSEEEEPSSTITPEEHSKFLKDLQRFREDIILDFRSFEASIARIQFLYSANEKERLRYSSDKVRISQTSEEVKESTALLKVRLEEAKRQLEVRKGYDVLAEKIKVGGLKDRMEGGVEVERLKVEIEELEREGVDLGAAWKERRELLARVAEEAGRLRRCIRGGKEPEEGDGDDNGGDDEEGEGDREGDDMLGIDGNGRDGGSNMGTPRPEEDAPTPLPGVHESGAMTPRSTLADAEVLTPRPSGQDTEMQEGEHGHDIPTIKLGDDMDTS